MKLFDDRLNHAWVSALCERPANYLFKQRTILEAQLQQPGTKTHQRTIAALALSEVLKELERRKEHWQSEERKALETLLAQPNLSTELRAWVRIELGYDKP